MLLKRNIFLFFALLFNVSYGYSQLITSNTMTVQQLVQNVLAGEGVAISNITYKGFGNAIGYFNGSKSIIGLNKGVIMSTGKILDNINGPLGPNNLPESGIDNLSGTDLDLITLAGANVFNAAILEFDFIPQIDTIIKLRYAFASEEYPKYVQSQYNDVFGFFLSGPGISGPYNNNAVNIAVLPGTSTYISVNTINNGTDNKGPCNNCQYYIPNGRGFTPSINNTTQFNGLTTVFTAMHPVKCGETYHIKIVIGDTNDSSVDSGIFIEAKSFTSLNTRGIEANIITPSANDIIIEGCDSAMFVFTRPFNFNDSMNLKISISGTAANGIDYKGIADSVVFYPGDTTVNLTINPLVDGISEGPESVTITLVYSSGTCDYLDTAIVTVWIKDELLPISINVNDTLIPCSPGIVAISLSNSTGGVTPYNYYWSTSDTVSNPLINTEGTSSAYYVIVSDRCGNKDSTTFMINLKTFSFTGSSKPATCGKNNGIIELKPTNGVTPFNYSINNGSTYEPSPINHISSGFHSVLGVDGNGCRDTIVEFVEMASEPVKADFRFDEIFCTNQIQFINLSSDTLYSYWDFGDGTTSNENNPLHIYVATAKYTVMLISNPDSICADTAMAVIPFENDAFSDTLFIPNVFTPNGDGKNDYFEIKGMNNPCIDINRLIIFNRWGKKVFEAEGNELRWDGISNGNTFPDGIYFYVLEGKEFKKSGNVTLLR